jgi:hypothetical protein
VEDAEPQNRRCSSDSRWCAGLRPTLYRHGVSAVGWDEAEQIPAYLTLLQNRAITPSRLGFVDTTSDPHRDDKGRDKFPLSRALIPYRMHLIRLSLHKAFSGLIDLRLALGGVIDRQGTLFHDHKDRTGM